jgi:hypothetical protein
MGRPSRLDFGRTNGRNRHYLTVTARSGEGSFTTHPIRFGVDGQWRKGAQRAEAVRPHERPLRVGFNQPWAACGQPALLRSDT